MGAFKHHKAVSFQIGLCSDPCLLSWILGNDRKNINSGASAIDGIFAKSPRCDQGVSRLNGARGKKNKFGAPMFKPKVFWE